MVIRWCSGGAAVADEAVDAHDDGMGRQAAVLAVTTAATFYSFLATDFAPPGDGPTVDSGPTVPLPEQTADLAF